MRTIPVAIAGTAILLLSACVQPAAKAPQSAPAAPAPGQALYEKHCASCHDHPQATRAPAMSTLRGMRYGSIHFALTDGKMQVQGAALSAAERSTLIDYLVGRQPVDDSWIERMMCAPGRRTIDLAPDATVAGFGFDANNHRKLTEKQAGLSTGDFRQMELAWALAFPRATTMRSQPAVVGSTLFLPVADAAQLFAIDIADRPCFKWIYKSDVPLRTGAAYGTLPGSGRKVLVFGDVAAQVHMLDAATGEQIWRQPVRLTSLSNTTGTPFIHGDRVYVPISASEINVGHDDKHECCKTHGAVTALDAATGRKIWTAHTMEDAKPTHDRGDGQMMWGPSGGPIWTSPAIDEKRGVLYLGTGEATSAPAPKTTDAILAIDMQTGAIRWSFQATANDIFLTGCFTKRDGLNCPKEGHFLDVDFGASVVIAQRSDGKDILLAGQKSGTLWALDPDAKGKLLWRRDFGTGSPIGGIHWGLAYDGTRVFAPINAFPGADGKDPNQTAGLHAVKVDTGEVLWSYTAPSDCSGDRPTRIKGCQGGIGLSGAPTVIDGAVVEGSVDGFLRAFDAASGELLFQFDTARAYEAINGIPGTGGAIDNASIVAANGYLFVSSGYGLLGGQTPGNVFLAFRPVILSKPP